MAVFSSGKNMLNTELDDLFQKKLKFLLKEFHVKSHWKFDGQSAMLRQILGVVGWCDGAG